MCGIAGFCNGSSEYESMIRAMTDRIKHRGPDSDGYWYENDCSVVLGHRRLAIIDCTPLGAQPMISHDERFVISYNGEIYNHLDLKKILGKDGVCFSGESDTEVLLEMFAKYGIEHTLNCVKGMFAIALYDRDEKRLYLIRDRVGEKPLYYGMVDGRLAFASDLSSLKVISSEGLTIDRASVELFFRRGYVPTPYSIYEGIRKVGAGHYISIDYPFRECKDNVYWSQTDVSAYNHSNKFKGSEEEAAEELERLLTDAIKGQMISDVPLGVFLSAGIDSSTVTALMQEQSTVPIKTFTIGVENKEYDEAPIARRIAESLGTDHTEEYVSIPEIKAVIPTLCDMYSEPFADSSQIPTSIISRVARKKVTVALSGDGGDELFCGYDRYNGWVIDEWVKQKKYPYALQKARALALSSLGKSREMKTRRLLSSSLNETYSAVISNNTTIVLGDKVYSDTFDTFKPFDGSTDQDLLMQMDFQEYLVDDILVKVDRAAMYHSLETRIPFLDKDVVEFAWSLPLEMKFSQGVTKKLIRDIIYKRTDRELLERPKTGFSIPLDKWLKTGDLRAWAEEMLDGGRISKQGILDPRLVRRVWSDYLTKGKWSDTLWFTLIFQSWMGK